jgi:hypothetical protein
MFRFKRRPSSGSHRQYLAKMTYSVQCEYMEVVQTSVLWLHSMNYEACVLCTTHMPHRSYYAAITLKSVRPPCIHIERNV